MSCSIGWLKGIAEVVFLEMGEMFVENDFFKNYGQKWKVRNGTVVFQKIFVKWFLGDFNIDVQNTNSLFGLDQMITTRITPHSSTLIGHICT